MSYSAVAGTAVNSGEATILADRHHLYRNASNTEATWLILDQSLACRHRTPANTCWQHATGAWNPLARVQLSHSAGTGTACSQANVDNGTCPTNNLMATTYGQDYGASGWGGKAWWWYGEWTINGQPHRHLFKGFSANNTTGVYTNRDQNNICHEIGHQIGLDHWYDRRSSCLEDSVPQTQGWTCKDQAICDNPHAQDYADVDNDLMAHADASGTDPQCIIVPCGGGAGSGASKPDRMLLAEHETIGVPLNANPFASVLPDAVLRVYLLPGLSVDPRERKLLYTVVAYRNGSEVIPVG